jgi:hypothetical protein
MKKFCPMVLLCSFFASNHVIHSMDNETSKKLPGIEWAINPRVIKPEHASLGVTFVCHGFGGDGSLADYLADQGILAGTLITFEMIDSTAQGPLPLSKANFGQESDTKALAAVCVYAYEHFKDVPWHMLGLSRGGATVVNALGQMASYDTYATHLQSIGMSKELAATIIEKLQRGTIILDRPLHSVSSVISNKVDDVIGSSLRKSTVSSVKSTVDWTPWFIKDLANIAYRLSRASVASSVDCVSLPIVTRGNYVPWGNTPLKSALIIKPLNFNILVHIQNPDDVLGNDETVATFCKNLRGKNTLYCIKTGVGHNGFNTDIAQAFKLFRCYHQILENPNTPDDQKQIYIANNKSFITKLQPDDESLTDLVTGKKQ